MNTSPIDLARRLGLAACVFLAPASALHAQPAGSNGAKPANPFASFFGEWTLKDDKFQQVWDGKTVETLTIPNHHTKCEPINTDASVLCVVTAGDLNGHILWSYNSAKHTVHHLSHFGTERSGVGTGTIGPGSDLSTKVTFQGEPDGSYRKYVYAWVSKNEYTMMSTQFDSNDRPTGNWYGGTFIRLPGTAAEGH